MARFILTRSLILAEDPGRKKTARVKAWAPARAQGPDPKKGHDGQTAAKTPWAQGATDGWARGSRRMTPSAMALLPRLLLYHGRRTWDFLQGRKAEVPGIAPWLLAMGALRGPGMVSRKGHGADTAPNPRVHGGMAGNPAMGPEGVNPRLREAMRLTEVYIQYYAEEDAKATITRHAGSIEYKGVNIHVYKIDVALEYGDNMKGVGIVAGDMAIIVMEDATVHVSGMAHVSTFVDTDDTVFIMAIIGNEILDMSIDMAKNEFSIGDKVIKL